MSEAWEKNISDIMGKSKKIKAKVIAEEILNWLYNNVENYVDNKTKIYKIDLVVDSDEMPMTKELQDLYRDIPDDIKGNPLGADDKSIKETEKLMEDSSKCRRELDKIVVKAYEEMTLLTDSLNGLFKRLIFFYEKIIMNPENKKRAFQIDEELKTLIEGKENASEEEKGKIQERIVELIREGEELVKWEEFEGAVSITKFDYEAFSVGVRLSSKPTEEEIENGASEETIKDYVIPEGFVVWMEINYRLKARPTVMF